MEWRAEDIGYRLSTGKLLTRGLQEVDPDFVLFDLGPSVELMYEDRSASLGALTPAERREVAEFMAKRWLRWAARRPERSMG